MKLPFAPRAVVEKVVPPKVLRQVLGGAQIESSEAAADEPVAVSGAPASRASAATKATTSRPRPANGVSVPPLFEGETRPRLEPGAADVRRRLLTSGASERLVDAVVRRVVASGRGGTHAIDEAAQVLGQALRVHPSPRRLAEHPTILAFAGPPGAGKTTTLAKLGRRLQRAGRRVAFASFDPQSLAALERVGGHAADVDRTELPIAAVRNANDLRRFLRKAAGVEVVLLDTPGFSPREDAALSRFAETFQSCRSPLSFPTYLVLPASTSRGSLALSVQAFRKLGPDAVCITKLDETVEPAGALETALEARLPIAFFCDGQDVRTHLRRPTPDHFADLFLRGKLG